MDAQNMWDRFKSRLVYDAQTQFSLDSSRVNYDEAFLKKMEPQVQKAFDAMEALEKGEIANPDEKRMVGHYWLRDAGRAPNSELRRAIESTVSAIKTFAADVHSGKICNSSGEKFTHVLVVGIGGSALGPQFVNQALSSAHDPMKISFFDNTDPDGMAKVLYELKTLAHTLVIVISKSGGTKETRNGQLVAKAAFQQQGLDFSRHFVAVTGEGSELDKTAVAEKWSARFPMWDWVGGRTSEFSAVGLLPLALQGFDVDRVLQGAREMDVLTRERTTRKNPAAMLSLAWYHCGCGKGMKDMVVLPYKDRLELFSRYLQQLVMESLGKEHDLAGATVNQGIAVYGNKGSTDQHAYVQQLRDGVNNFFGVFIEVLRDESVRSIPSASLGDFRPARLEVEAGVTSGDYLLGFYLGTRTALYEKNRENLTVTIPEVNEFYVGMLIALFERTVGLYASLININAYHQPGVEAGKKAAAEVLRIQGLVEKALKSAAAPMLVEEVVEATKLSGATETVFKIIRHLASNGRVKVQNGNSIFDDRYSAG
jgi:glucose-6-phosphate isomerase